MQSAQLMAFVSTANPEAAMAFYKDVLGLTLVAEESMALVFDSDGTLLRISKVEDLNPQAFTVLGWQVADIRREMGALISKGVSFELYGFPGQDETGVWDAGGALVAWFKDPDGNLLSLTQLSRQ